MSRSLSQVGTTDLNGLSRLTQKDAGIARSAVVDHLRVAADKFTTWTLAADASLPSTFDWVASQMHRINHRVFEAEMAGVEKAVIPDMLTGVREVQAGSPFVSRLQQWPRGYQGGARQSRI